MKVLVCDAPKKLRVEEVPDMPLDPGSLRIETLFSGISHGTEMGIYRGIAPQFTKKQDKETRLFLPSETEVFTYPYRSCDPGVWYLGYSNVGRVIEVGSDVTGFAVGDMVFSASAHQSQVIVPARSMVVKIPDSVKPEHAVVFTNSITTHGGIMDSHIKLGDVVVVVGLGVLGQLCVQQAKLSGATKVFGVDVIELRRNAAKENGCDAVFDPTSTDVALEIRKLTGNKGPDVVMEVSGNGAALNEAIRIAAPETTVTILGWYKGELKGVDLSAEFHHNRIGLKQSQLASVDPSIANLWGFGRRMALGVELLPKLKLDNIVTNIIPFEEVGEAYRLIDEHPEQVIQVVLSY